MPGRPPAAPAPGDHTPEHSETAEQQRATRAQLCRPSRWLHGTLAPRALDESLAPCLRTVATEASCQSHPAQRSPNLPAWLCSLTFCLAILPAVQTTSGCPHPQRTAGFYLHAAVALHTWKSQGAQQAAMSCLHCMCSEVLQH